MQSSNALFVILFLETVMFGALIITKMIGFICLRFMDSQVCIIIIIKKVLSFFVTT